MVIMPSLELRVTVVLSVIYTNFVINGKKSYIVERLRLEQYNLFFVLDGSAIQECRRSGTWRIAYQCSGLSTG